MNLKQLSERLNLSQTTVSRALNGYPEVNEGTRKRVAAAAAKYRYHPNVRARTLATGRSMSIGHVIPLSQQVELVNLVFSDFVAGAGVIYAEHGYNMTLTIVQDVDELDAYRRLSEHGAVDGVIVQAPARDDQRISFLSDLKIPFVVHGRATAVTAPYAWLDVNNKSAFQTGTEYLISLGHHRIALVNGQEKMDFAIRRREGYTEAVMSAGLSLDQNLMSSADMSEPNGYAAACRFLDLDDPPTAFIASSIVLALGIKRAIRERGLRLGVDVSVLSYDDDISYLPNTGDTPLFTTMRSSVKAAGAHCARMLIDLITTPDAPLPTELWEAEFVLGTSTGPGPFA
ncbi:MAG: substrate-binding domain-containing protein [Roseobacter sp.]